MKFVPQSHEIVSNFTFRTRCGSQDEEVKPDDVSVAAASSQEALHIEEEDEVQGRLVT